MDETTRALKVRDGEKQPLAALAQQLRTCLDAHLLLRDDVVAIDQATD